MFRQAIYNLLLWCRRAGLYVEEKGKGRKGSGMSEGVSDRRREREGETGRKRERERETGK